YMDEAERCNSVGYIYQSNLIALGKIDELRNLPVVTDARKKHLEVSCEQIMPTFQYFKSKNYVDDVTIFGRTLHLVVPAEMSTETIQNELANTSLDVTDIRQIRPSLEDVFVTLSEREEARRMTANML
ncbi:MAG: DUF4162 domain-containing protein, partial [Candidatus Melainabacteria bacterium]|nr:DUF4162 domain-containing protein [Candidatus Melainabacteria bacterium]